MRSTRIFLSNGSGFPLLEGGFPYIMEDNLGENSGKERKMNEFGKYISILFRHTQMYYNSHLQGLNIGSGQFDLIIHICENAGLSQEALANQFAMNKSTITRIMKSLEADGYIFRSVNGQDRRVLNVIPYGKSLCVLPEIQRIRSNWNREILMDLDEDGKGKILVEQLQRATENALSLSKK